MKINVVRIHTQTSCSNTTLEHHTRTPTLKHRYDLHREKNEDEDCCVLRLLPGPGDPSHDFSSSSSSNDHMRQNLTKRKFKVTPRTERMACVLTLDDEELEFPIQGGQQISEPCVQGT